jgi:hypothetical protein
MIPFFFGYIYQKSLTKNVITKENILDIINSTDGVNFVKNILDIFNIQATTLNKNELVEFIITNFNFKTNHSLKIQEIVDKYLNKKYTNYLFNTQMIQIMPLYALNIDNSLIESKFHVFLQNYENNSHYLINNNIK